MLRKEFRRRKLDGFVVPMTDEHMSEYVGRYARRLTWLTGFRGSAGSAVVLSERAAIFVDGRYTQQVRKQVDARYWIYQDTLETSNTAWLGQHAPEGSRIGYDPWLHTKSWVETTAAALAHNKVELVAVDTNPVDHVWSDRPLPSNAKLIAHPLEIAGRSSAEKRREISEWLIANKADAVVLSALDSIAWIFNIRGEDVPRTPVALAYAVVHADSSADLFVAAEKLTTEVVDHLGGTVRLWSREAFFGYLKTLVNNRVVVDLGQAAVAISSALESCGAELMDARDPTALAKAIKNATEVEGQKAAQVRDGAVLSQFLHWLSIEAPKGKLTETSAAAKLLELRADSERWRDLSFDTISAFGPNGSIAHYRADDETDRRIAPGSLYLVDSGSQYLDGTTDVTRTVAIGTPSAEMRDRFTRVLRGHIALLNVVFPVGTRGSQLDTLARQYLWSAGLDYAHGTGHGVGAYLTVHEGPQRIFSTAAYPVVSDEPLAEGMILSNEPAYYKLGEYGIRIENLMLVVKREIPGAEREMLGFETLTLVPIDRALINCRELTADDRTWINKYHAEIARAIGSGLQGAAKAWLMNETRPLD